MRSFNKLLASLIFLAGAPVLGQNDPVVEGDAARPPIALMGTVPIYWGEAAGFDELLQGEVTVHWARDVLEKHAEPVPLDYLSQEALAPFDMLLMAQPRGLTAEENVALDGWVRSGGRLLLFADPMMTGASRFGIGDRRRPQDVILLSPILSHWGLDLQYDEGQAAGMDSVEQAGVAIPFNLRGRLVVGEAASRCTVLADHLIAQCKLGAGTIQIVADAALTDLEGPHPGARNAFAWLLGQVFPEFGDDAGNRPITRPDSPLSGANLPDPSVNRVRRLQAEE